jgi:hypothetical protein
MAKKVSLPGSDSVAKIVADASALEHGGVRTTPESARNPNILSRRAAEDPAIFPEVDATCLNAQDANDNTQDGKQDSFSMPAFANGRDMRPGR